MSNILRVHIPSPRWGEGRVRGIRVKEIAKKGIELLRFNDMDILRNIEAVCEKIRQVVDDKKELFSPSP